MRPLFLLLAAFALVACGSEAPSASPADAPLEAAVVDVSLEAATDAPPADAPPDAAATDSAVDAAVDIVPRCAPPAVLCDEVCQDLQTNPLNCGACGRACAADESCLRGGCVRFVDASVDAPDVAPDVPDAGCASNTPGNCCGVACPVRANAVAATCTAGRCGFVCAMGYGDCDGNAANGCEVNLRSDAAHCGACAAACVDGRNCERSACVCPSGRGDCDGDTANGCEVDLRSNRDNCGVCGTVCLRDPARYCRSGTCAP